MNEYFYEERNWPLEHTVLVRLAVCDCVICRYKMKSFLGLVTCIHPNGKNIGAEETMAKLMTKRNSCCNY